MLVSFFFVDCLKVNKTISTSGTIDAKRHGAFMFHCSFEIEPAKNDRIQSLDCGYNDTSTNKLIKLATLSPSGQLQKAPSIPAIFSGRVKVYSSNYSFEIESLQFSDQKTYFCNLNLESQVVLGVSKLYPLSVTFGPAYLQVEG